MSETTSEMVRLVPPYLHLLFFATSSEFLELQTYIIKGIRSAKEMKNTSSILVANFHFFG